jgi:predicted branched-subunit amino acid permease
MMANPSFRSGLRDGVVILVAVGAFGVAFGALAVNAGLAGWLAIAASVIVVSGAAQFAMVGLLASGAAPVLIATTGLALRHLPMSARLADMIGPRSPTVRAALAYVLVDETFGLTVNASRRGVPDLVAYKFGADVLLFTGWVSGTLIGVILGSAADPERWGADVFFALLFLGLATPLVRTRRDWIVAALAIVVALGSTLLLPEAWQITGAAVVAAAIGAGFRA